MILIKTQNRLMCELYKYYPELYKMSAGQRMFLCPSITLTFKN